MAGRLGRDESHRGRINEVTLAHVYRAEVGRSTVWRTRLDTTTNWAITTAAAVVSLAFSSATTPHATLLVGLLLIVVFLVIESRRYRYYDLWARRVQIMETGWLVPLLRQEESSDFDAVLAQELVKPRLRISRLDSLTFRFSRTYAPIVALLLGGWVVKLDLHPSPAEGWRAVVARARIGPIGGGWVWAAWCLVAAAFAYLFWRSLRSPLPPTELRPPARRVGEPLGSTFRRLVETELRGARRAP